MRGLDRFAEERFTSGELNVAGAENSGTRHRILVGVSRKSMIYKKFGITPEESLPQTQVLHLAALQKGFQRLSSRTAGMLDCERVSQQGTAVTSC